MDHCYLNWINSSKLHSASRNSGTERSRKIFAIKILPVLNEQNSSDLTDLRSYCFEYKISNVYQEYLFTFEFSALNWYVNYLEIVKTYFN